MKILIITDIHYGEDTNYPVNKGEGYVNSFGSHFEKFIHKIRELAAEHDLLINLGDLIHNVNNEQDFTQYKKAMGLLEMGKPVKHVMGNHDFAFIPRSLFAEFVGADKAYYSFDLGGYHHIVLDSFRNLKTESCRIDEEQKKWLQEDLNSTNLSTLVYCHYPLDEQSLEDNYYFKGKPDRAFIENRSEVRKILESSGKVLAVFNGHLHFYNKEVINGIQYITVPAFTENDGTNKPKAECVSVELEGEKVDTKFEKVAC